MYRTIVTGKEVHVPGSYDVYHNSPRREIKTNREYPRFNKHTLRIRGVPVVPTCSATARYVGNTLNTHPHTRQPMNSTLLSSSRQHQALRLLWITLH